MAETVQGGSIIRDLTVGSVPKQLLRFAYPLFFSGFLQVVYNMVDMVVVGQVLGKNGLSAVSLSGDFLTFITFIATGLSAAGQVVISQYIGAGLKEKLNSFIGTLFSFLVCCALVLSILCLCLCDSILLWAKVPASALRYARDYLLTSAAGLIFVYGYNLVSAILRGMGDSRHPFIFIATASIINVLLDLLFVAVFRWGTFGAALATITSQGISFISAFIFLYRRKEAFCFDFRLSSFRIRAETLSTLLRLGIPMVLQSAAISFSRLFITSWINTYGVTVAAVTGIGNKLQTLTNVFTHALSTAGSSMIAQCIGAEKYDRVPKVIRTSFLFDSAIVIILSVVTALYPRFIFGFFVKDADVLALSVSFVPIALLLYGGCAFRPPMLSLINGSGNSRLNLAIGLLDGFISRIGLALLLGITLNMGAFGFWLGNALSGYVPFLIGFPYYVSGKWRTRKYLL